MSEHHFNYFRVKNFKRFKDLEVKDIGQFNLVLGDNNVGKTSLLEALMWERGRFVFGDDKRFDSKFIPYLFKNQFEKNYGVSADVFWKLYSNVEGDQKIEFLNSRGDTQEIITYKPQGLVLSHRVLEDFRNFYIDFETSRNGSILSLSTEGVKINQERIGELTTPFIPFGQNLEKNVVSLYSKNIQFDKQKRANFIKGVTKLFPEIEGVEPSELGEENSLMVIRKTSNYNLNLTSFGDGFIKTIIVLMYLDEFAQNKLMIDEIDAGIHYSRMKDYWKVILQSAKDNDVQIFATTHNRECIESFNQALVELGAEYQEKARTITLKESPKGQNISAYTNTFEVLDDALEIGNDLR